MSSFAKAALWFFAVIALLAITAVILINYYFLPDLKERIISKVNRSGEGLYQLTMDSLEVDVFSGNAYAGNIHLYTDEEMRRSETPPSITFDANSITAKDIRWVHYIFTKHLVIGDIEIMHPAISYADYKKEKEKDHKTIAEKLPPLLKPLCKSFKVEHFSLKDGKVNYKKASKKGTTRHEINNGNLALHGVHVVSSSKKPLYADRLSFALTGYKVVFPFYSSSRLIDSIHGDTHKKSVFLKGFSFESKPDQVSYNIPRYTISTHSIKAHSVNFRRLLHLKEVDIHSCELDKVTMHIFENSNLPPLRKVKLFPYEIFHEIIPVAFSIGAIAVSNGNFIYNGILPEAKDAVKIPFENTEISITSLNNAADSGEMTNVQASGQLFGAVPVQAAMEIPLYDPDVNFSYQGNIGKMNLELLNPIITRASPAEIKHGTVHSGSFDFKVGNGTAAGSVSADYEDLKIELKSGLTGRKLRLADILGNQRIINKSKGTVTENIEYTHQETESFFLFLIRPLIAGAVKIVLKGEENKKAVEKITHPKRK